MSGVSKNFDEFIKQLEELNEDLDTVGRNVVNRAVNEGMSVTIDATPKNKSKYVIGGTLQKGWISTPAQRKGKSWEGKFTNNVEYGIYVNFGHRIVSKGRTVEYLPGVFFLEAGADHAWEHMEQYFEDEINRIKGGW